MQRLRSAPAALLLAANPLNRDDLVPLDLRRQQSAHDDHRLAVQQHQVRAALARIISHTSRQKRRYGAAV